MYYTEGTKNIYLVYLHVVHFCNLLYLRLIV